MSGPTFETLIQAAQKEVLDSYKKEFDSLVGSFRDLDSKAQGTVAIAGVFLAAALAFMNREGVLNSYVSRNLAIFIVLSLTAAIAFSVQALRIRRLPNLPSGDDVSGLLQALAKAGDQDELKERLVYFCGDAAALWRSCIRQRREVNEEKADHIWSAQKSLMFAAACVATLILSSVINPEH
jgi:hypothetical protein